jgi:CPA1 family monovalent cation:H+ antiporter
MQASDIHHFELLLLFIMTLVLALAVLARRFELPYPIVLVAGGLGVSLLPNVPRVELNPDIIFLVLLPPLLFGAAFHTSWRNFRANIAKISTMAFGLVGFTAVAVSFLAGRFIPGFDPRVGFVLGALVASTDPIAATAIAKRMHLPRRIVDVLEGESLINDATSLVALEFSVGMLVSDTVPTVSQGVLRLIFLSCGGMVIGLIAGWLIRRFQLHLTDAPVEITLTLVAPYVAYLAAESIHTSGVLATVACGLYLGEKQSESLSARARIEASAVWNTLDFVLNGIVFALIGLQLPQVIEGIRGTRLTELALDSAFLIVLLIALRLAWVFAASWIAFALRKAIRRRAEPPRARESFLVGWTGMRGVIALAAAMALPDSIDSGADFPQRDVLIFLSFVAIIGTLVLQGLSLPWLIRKLGFQSNDLRGSLAAAGRSGSTAHREHTLEDPA